MHTSYSLRSARPGSHTGPSSPRCAAFCEGAHTALCGWKSAMTHTHTCNAKYVEKSFECESSEGCWSLWVWQDNGNTEQVLKSLQNAMKWNWFAVWCTFFCDLTCEGPNKLLNLRWFPSSRYMVLSFLQVQDLTEQVQSKTEADDAIMVAVNNKIEEWQVCRAILTPTGNNSLLMKGNII